MTDSAVSRDGWAQRVLLPGELLADGVRPHLRRTGRDWAMDGLFFLWSTGVFALLLIDLPTRDYLPDWMLAVDPWLGGAACLAIWWRRQHPLVLGLAAVPVTFLSSTAFGAMTVIVLNIGLRLPPRTALLVIGAHLAAVVPYLLEYSVPHEGGYVAVAFLVAYYLFFFAWGASVRLRRQLVIRLRADARRERAEHTRRLVDARRTEREAIAREMHDVLAHRISLLSVHAGALAYRTDASAGGTAKPLSDSEIGDSVRVIRDTAHQALEELREVLTVLRGRGTAEGGQQLGIADIGRLVADAERAGQRVVLTRELDAGAAAALRGPVQRTAYRVVQEGLTNARKHAAGAPVQVVLSGAPGQGLMIAVRNALGARPATEIPGAGAGLAGLEERAALDGGVLRHGPSAAGDEFELVAELPWGPAPLGRDPKVQPQLPPH
ncbi:sensor histidine kinase [Streptomyces mayteni]